MLPPPLMHTRIKTSPSMTSPDPINLTANTEDHQAPNAYWKQRQLLGKALRVLGNLLSSREVSQAEVEKLTTRINALNQRLMALPELAGRKAWSDAGLAPDLDGAAHELSPLIGKSAIVGPELKIRLEHGEGIGEVNCDWRFEGPPRCLHGGYVAALFDEFLGWVQMFSGGSGATKVLSITYHKPTPLNTDLILKAKLHSVEGRKIRVTGEMWAGNIMTASAEGLFISFGELGTRELYKNM